jgi:hypothetical protein
MEGASPVNARHEAISGIERTAGIVIFLMPKLLLQKKPIALKLSVLDLKFTIN